MYSFRHSAITFRLLYGQGIDLLTLARNARTSADVINTYYASTGRRTEHSPAEKPPKPQNLFRLNAEALPLRNVYALFKTLYGFYRPSRARHLLEYALTAQ
jgi:hypothetical protein